MYIYADESGHSGKHIFNDPPWYFQAAILSPVDTEPILSVVANKYIRELGVDRLHANELKFDVVETVTSSLIELLSDLDWEFHVIIIEKPYLSVTKFVDSVFDSFENRGARWLWYNHELFRHTLCILFDEVLIRKKKKEFWNAYLKDDYGGICSVVKWALKKLDGLAMDQRLRMVATDGLSFALKYPEEITLLASRTRKSYRGHTPNMVAFSSLIHEIHSFCKKNNVVPSAFVHDSQSEFSSSMREYHNIFSGVRISDNDHGLITSAEKTNYDLGKFSMPLSKNVISLQACDLFLKLYQRSDSIRSIGLREKFLKKINPFSISRQCSEMIVYSWFFKLSNADLTDEQIQTGKEIIEKMEDRFFKERAEFESKKSPLN